jgi:hypothetical protein
MSKSFYSGTRVTRLVEFSPIGRLLTLGIFAKYGISINCCDTFFIDQVMYVLILTKNGLSYIFGYFL